LAEFVVRPIAAQRAHVDERVAVDIRVGVILR
jgi:hypothetical protein